MRVASVSILCLLVLGACGGGRMGDGAVQLGDGVYMAPAGRDAGGCPQYRMSSSDGGALRQPFYRTAEGDFTTVRADAACAP